MEYQIYQCFHDQGSYPEQKYISDIRPALLCGSSATHRDTDDITGCLRDDTGENISSENPQYSELTGYYWVWRNRPSNYVGIEHYRRHFLSTHVKEIDGEVKSEDLLTADEIQEILNQCDIIIPVHESLWNTSVFDLYEICFYEQSIEMVHWMNEYFKLDKNYTKSVHNYLANNVLVRGNMLITTWQRFNHYCCEMFNMINFIKARMKVKPESRVWGYITGTFPMIYINRWNLSYKEVHVAVDDFDWEKHEPKLFTTLHNKEVVFDKDKEEQIRYLASL